MMSQFHECIASPAQTHHQDTPSEGRRAKGERRKAKNCLLPSAFCLLPSAICYLSFWLVPLALTYDLIECLLAACSPTGRRLGDFLAGTQVVPDL